MQLHSSSLECLPIASTVSCSPYTAGFYINSTALSARYAAIMPQFVAASPKIDAVSGGVDGSRAAKVIVASLQSSNNLAASSKSSSSPLSSKSNNNNVQMTAQMWDQMVAAMTSPSSPQAAHYASLVDGSKFTVSSTCSPSSSSSSSSNSQSGVYGSMGNNDDILLNSQDPSSNNKPMLGSYQRSVVCGYDIFVLSAGCNSREARLTFSTSTSTSSVSSSAQHEQHPQAAQTKQKRNVATSSSASSSSIDRQPVQADYLLPLCSSVCASMRTSMLAAEAELSVNCLSRRDDVTRKAMSTCNQVVSSMRSNLLGVNEKYSSGGYCSMGVQDDIFSCGYAGSAEAVSSYCSSSGGSNSACCNYIDTEPFQSTITYKGVGRFGSSAVLSNMLQPIPRSAIIRPAPIVSYEWSPFADGAAVYEASSSSSSGNANYNDDMDAWDKWVNSFDVTGYYQSELSSRAPTPAVLTAAEEANRQKTATGLSMSAVLPWDLQRVALAFSVGKMSQLPVAYGSTSNRISAGSPPPPGGSPPPPTGSGASKPPSSPSSSSSKPGSSTTTNTSSSSSLSTGAIAGIAIGSVFVVAGVIAGTVVVIRNRRADARAASFSAIDKSDSAGGGLTRGLSRKGTSRLNKRVTLTGGNSAGRNSNDSSAGASSVKPNPRAPSRESGRSRVKEVVFEYEPAQPDEIALMPGDYVEVSVSYDDGWATGKNLTTGRIGTFPLTCLDGDQ